LRAARRQYPHAAIRRPDGNAIARPNAQGQERSGGLPDITQQAREIPSFIAVD
jgi:hypothetical protein